MAIKLRPFLALALLLAIPLVASGRLVRIWTYEQMHEQADLVVIAKPVSSTPTNEKTSLPNKSRDTRRRHGNKTRHPASCSRARPRPRPPSWTILPLRNPAARPGPAPLLKLVTFNPPSNRT